jgi:hypothetical protein
VESCDQCAEEGVKCCAGPLKESSYARRYDKSGGSRVRPAQQQAGVESGEGEEKQAERMFVSCNQCRDLGKRCSLKGRNDWGPCSCCRKINEQCKFVLPPLRQRRLLEAPALSPPLPKKRKGKSSRSKRERSSTPEGRGRKKLGDPYTPTTHSRRLLEEAAQLGWKQGRRALKKGPHHILLKTSFCHPIKFNYVPDPMGLEPCDWCRSPFFGFYGLSDSSGPRIVEGYWLQDGEGFEEVHGGYSEVEDQNGELHDRTRMCVGCTFERVRIFSCPEHHIRRLQIGTEIDPKVHDDEAWTESVDALQAGDEERGALVLNSKWCSVCPELASFTCACPPSYTLSGDLSFSTNSLSGKEEEHDDGCGLLLCEGCKELMDHCLKSGYKRGSESLDAVVGKTMRNKWLSPRGVRADAEFLTSEGELMVRIGQGMGMEIEIEMSEEYEEAGQVSEVEEEQGIGWKGKGKEVEMFSPLGIQGRKGREVWGGELNCGGKAKRKGNHFSSSGGLMNSNLEHEHQKEMSFGQKIQVGVAHHKQRTAANHHNNTIGSGGWMNDDLEQKIRFGEKIRNGVKRGKEKAKEEGKIPWFNRERGVWGEVSIIDLIDDD